MTKQLKRSNLSEEEQDAIITAAYGDIPLMKHAFLYIKILFNNEKRALYKEHKKISKASGSLWKSSPCPEDLIDRTYAALNLRKEKAGFWESIYSALALRPVIPFAAAALIIALVLAPCPINKQAPSPKHTPQEVAEAKQEAELVLGYVGSVLQAAEKTAVEETLYQQVSKPLNESINSINIILGGENETDN